MALDRIKRDIKHFNRDCFKDIATNGNISLKKAKKAEKYKKWLKSEITMHAYKSEGYSLDAITELISELTTIITFYNKRNTPLALFFMPLP